MTIKKYKAYAKMSVSLVAEFELDDESGIDPFDYAKDIDGAEFKEIDGSDEWGMYDVYPVDQLNKFFGGVSPVDQLSTIIEGVKHD